MAWQAVAKLSLLRKSRNCVAQAEGRLAVGYPYSIISLVQKEKEKDVNEPLVIVTPKGGKVGYRTLLHCFTYRLLLPDCTATVFYYKTTDTKFI